MTKPDDVGRTDGGGSARRIETGGKPKVSLSLQYQTCAQRVKKERRKRGRIECVDVIAQGEEGPGEKIESSQQLSDKTLFYERRVCVVCGETKEAKKVLKARVSVETGDIKKCGVYFRPVDDDDEEVLFSSPLRDNGHPGSNR